MGLLLLAVCIVSVYDGVRNDVHSLERVLGVAASGDGGHTGHGNTGADGDSGEHDGMDGEAGNASAAL